ncbi:hypothetical protein CEXT_772441 [Caerostris extrusa]|uniref:Uncharacterized protein n=1 Tax=Caerostris extrusa TaxID=172846 RepID=A0AAV4P204_CAEEX|nr:hypothetical protein CEXT_772441 [Caerostris extrusa]
MNAGPPLDGDRGPSNWRLLVEEPRCDSMLWQVGGIPEDGKSKLTHSSPPLSPRTPPLPLLHPSATTESLLQEDRVSGFKPRHPSQIVPNK